MDPFAPPVQDGPHYSTGSVEVGAALSEGFSALVRNILPLFGAAALMFVAYIVSICTCVGWIVILPLLMWGLQRFTLTMLDGKGRLQVLSSGTERLWTVVGRMWVFILLVALAGFPIFVAVGAAVGYQTLQTLNGEPPNPFLTQGVIFVVAALWGLVLVRIQPAPYLMVERDATPLDALQEAWSATGPHWGKLMGLSLLTTLFSAPATVLQMGNEYITAGTQDDPAQALEMLPLSVALMGGGLLWSAVVGSFFLLVGASVYRQLFGPAPQAA